LLTAAILIAAAATLDGGGSAAHAHAPLQSIGEIAEALTPVLGENGGRVVFAAGVLGAAMVAAVVASLALAWGIGELTGYRHTLESRPQQAPWFYGIYALAVAASAALVGVAHNLVWLNIGAQIVNALLLPLVFGLLIALAVRALPPEHRLAGAGKWTVIAVTAAVCALGWIGAVLGWGAG
jgi:Mn2+/Fe2+ NRAMP family transporter